MLTSIIWVSGSPFTKGACREDKGKKSWYNSLVSLDKVEADFVISGKVVVTLRAGAGLYAGPTVLFSGSG